MCTRPWARVRRALALPALRVAFVFRTIRLRLPAQSGSPGGTRRLLLLSAAPPAAAGDRLLRTLAGPGIRPCSLAARRQGSAGTQGAGGADVNKSLDAHLYFASQLALDGVLLTDVIAQPRDLVFGQIAHAGVGADPGGRQGLAGARPADAVQVRQPDFHPLFPRQIDAFDSGHRPIPVAACAAGCHK